MTHVPTHRPSIGRAAHGRHEIRALENVGRTPGGIQYRTQTGAQAELTLPTATDFTLGHDGIRPTWVSATQVATATQPVVSFLHTVTASASQIIISWASVATQYSRFEIELYQFKTSTSAKLASRFSTDGLTVDTATNRNYWVSAIGRNRVIPVVSVYGSTATNSASQSVLTGTDYGLSTLGQLIGQISIWPDSMSNTVFPMMDWSLTWFSTDNGDNTLLNANGAAHYWERTDIKGIALFPVVGSASFTDGLAMVYGHA